MTWCPPSGCQEIDGCIWLPRLVSKARRVLELGAGNAIGDYMYGANDPVDGELLRFLGVTDRQVLDIVRDEPSDEAAARRILSLSGKTQSDRRNFSLRFRRRNAIFLAMMDADENRAPRGLRTAVLRFVYNRVIVPPVHMYFAMKEREVTTLRKA
jgi:Domain of unknown function (DUF5069)